METVSPLMLLVDDEVAIQSLLSDTVESQGWEAITASNAAEALGKLEHRKPDAVITDLRMPGGMDGFQLFQTIRRLHDDIPVVIMSAYGNIETAVESIKCGAFDYLPKPFKIERVIGLLKSLDAASQLNAKSERARRPVDEIVGRSAAIDGVREFVDRASRFDSAVFMQGEDGTGKEFVSRCIHLRSQRADQPFLTFSCGAMDDDLIERALFGQESGTPGNETSHEGCLERAGKGTVFLDEIAEIPGHVQASLLQAIEEGVFRPVGSDREIELGARLMVATSSDLTQAIQNGKFRRDLFYRLHVLPIHLPPLRSRTEDIPLLFEHFVGKLSGRGIEERPLSADAQAQLISYHWPGNVRELENCVERCLVMSTGPEILREDLPQEVRRSATPSTPRESVVGCRLKDYEHAAVLNALRVSKGNKRQASRILEISIATLYKKLKDYNIEI